MVKETCREVIEKFGSMKISKTAKDKLWASHYKDFTFEWELTLIDTKKNLRGEGFISQFKCSDSKSHEPVLAVLFPDSAMDFVLSLFKNKTRKIRGKLVEHSTKFGLATEAVQFPL